MKQGQWREARGHRHVGGVLGLRDESRHYGADIALYVAIAAVAASAVATGVSTYAAYEQSETQKKYASYNKKVAQNQAIASRQSAEVEAGIRRDRARRLIASQRAQYGAAGVEVNEGSPLLVQADTAYQGELDAQRALYGGELAATGAQSQAGFFEYQRRVAAHTQPIAVGGTAASGLASTGYSAYGLYGSMPRQQQTPARVSTSSLLAS